MFAPEKSMMKKMLSMEIIFHTYFHFLRYYLLFFGFFLKFSSLTYRNSLKYEKLTALKRDFLFEEYVLYLKDFSFFLFISVLQQITKLHQ